MRKAVVAVGWLVLFPWTLLAQSDQLPHPTPKAELFGGYSLVHLEGSDMNGWGISLAGNVNKNLGIVGDFSRHSNRESSLTVLGTAKSELTFHSFMAGPRITERKLKWITPFTHALFGMTRVNAKLRLSGNPATAGTTAEDQTGFSMALGGGLDISADDRYFIRLLQADYYLIRADKIKHEGLRLSVGVLIRFGRREN